MKSEMLWIIVTICLRSKSTKGLFEGSVRNDIE